MQAVPAVSVSAGRRDNALASTLLDHRVLDISVGERFERATLTSVKWWAHKLRAGGPPPTLQLARVPPQALLEVLAIVTTQ
jgi:hypothetical protein